MKVKNIDMVSSSQNNLFPVFLKLEQLHVLVVGGGVIGLEKVTALVNNSPATRITIVARVISHEIKTSVEQISSITLLEKII